MSYADKLRDPRWQRKRLFILARDDWRCVLCGEATETLMVHHRSYLRGKEPWDYPEAMLCTLCEYCHASEHEDRQRAEKCLVSSMYESGAFAPQIHELGMLFTQCNVVFSQDEWRALLDEFLSVLALARKTQPDGVTQ